MKGSKRTRKEDSEVMRHSPTNTAETSCAEKLQVGKRRNAKRVPKPPEPQFHER